jgi:hypothetical protein
MNRVIFETADKMYRIIEVMDDDISLDDLKGDSFNSELNTDLDREQLKIEEKQFEELVNNEGVYGYILEKWNSLPGMGYEHVDSCFGFVCQYSENESAFNHYIVEELKSLIDKK